MNNNYMIGTGYWHPAGPEHKAKAQSFYSLWIENKTAHSRPEFISIIGVGGCHPKVEYPDFEQVFYCQGNLGHVHQLIGVEGPPKSNALCGWSASILALAMLAYNAELDFVYCEQDMLMFGDCIAQMYGEIGDRKMIFGRLKAMPAAQSLFLVKHDFIPDFVRDYINLGPDRVQPTVALPEHKFMALAQRYPHIYGQFSFPFDRDRPLNYDLPCWYGQKFTPEEMAELIRRGLI